MTSFDGGSEYNPGRADGALHMLRRNAMASSECDITYLLGALGPWVVSERRVKESANAGQIVFGGDCPRARWPRTGINTYRSGGLVMLQGPAQVRFTF
jgi:hypothetical protein